MDSSGIVYIAEDSELQDAFRFSGLFSAHREDDDSEAGTDGTQGVPLEDAIAWGRGMADIVLVRIAEDEEFYSAGPIDPDVPTQPYPTEATLQAAIAAPGHLVSFRFHQPQAVQGGVRGQRGSESGTCPAGSSAPGSSASARVSRPAASA